MTYNNVWIVTNYIGGGIRGVYPSQEAAEASIREIRREYPDMKRPDFTVQVERIRVTVDEGTSNPARFTPSDEGTAIGSAIDRSLSPPVAVEAALAVPAQPSQEDREE